MSIAGLEMDLSFTVNMKPFLRKSKVLSFSWHSVWLISQCGFPAIHNILSVSVSP